MEIKIYSNNIPDEVVSIVKTLGEEIFGNIDIEEVKWRLKNQDDVLLLLAFVNDLPIGFKLGHRRGRTKFLSWIGGVRKESRGIGVATKLMEAQFEWCKSNGYKSIQTQTLNKWKNMLILNLKHGYEIVGVFEDHGLGQKIMLKKNF